MRVLKRVVICAALFCVGFFGGRYLIGPALAVTDDRCIAIDAELKASGVAVVTADDRLMVSKQEDADALRIINPSLKMCTE